MGFLWLKIILIKGSNFFFVDLLFRNNDKCKKNLPFCVQYRLQWLRWANNYIRNQLKNHLQNYSRHSYVESCKTGKKKPFLEKKTYVSEERLSKLCENKN